MKLNNEGPLPLYYQLEVIIREKIENEDYKIREQIPSEKNLAEEFGVSRMTARKAINNLVKEGILERRRGQGTFVNRRRIDYLPGLMGFSEQVEMKGMKATSKLLEQKIIIANEEIAQRLTISEGEEVIFTARLRLADNEVLGFEKSYIPYCICPELLKIDIVEESIYNYLKEAGYKPSKAVQESEAIKADEKISNLLNMTEGEPILKNIRLTFSGSIPIEFSRNFYKGGKHKVITTLTN